MRFMLLEDLRSAIDAIRRQCPNVPSDEESLKKILSLDPTFTVKAGKDFFKNKKGDFTDWLLRRYNNGEDLFIKSSNADLYEVTDLLVKFNLFCNREWLIPPENTIDHFKTIDELAATINRAAIGLELSRGHTIDYVLSYKPEAIRNSDLSDYEVETWFLYQKLFINPDKELPVVFKDDHYIVYQVNSLRADMLLREPSDKYGRLQAAWCTGALSSRNYYYYYLSNASGDPYYVILDTLNNKEKFLIHLTTHQLFDGRSPERPISFDRFTDDSALVNFFYEKLTQLPKANQRFNPIDNNTGRYRVTSYFMKIPESKLTQLSKIALVVLAVGRDDNLFTGTVLHWMNAELEISDLQVHDLLIRYIVMILSPNRDYWYLCRNADLLISIADPQEAESVAEYIYQKLNSNTRGKNLITLFKNEYLDYIQRSQYYGDNYELKKSVLVKDDLGRNVIKLGMLNGEPLYLVLSTYGVPFRLTTNTLLLESDGFSTDSAFVDPSTDDITELKATCIKLLLGESTTGVSCKLISVSNSRLAAVDLAINDCYRATNIKSLLKKLINIQDITVKIDNRLLQNMTNYITEKFVSFITYNIPELYLEYNPNEYNALLSRQNNYYSPNNLPYLESYNRYRYKKSKNITRNRKYY